MWCFAGAVHTVSMDQLRSDAPALFHCLPNSKEELTQGAGRCLHRQEGREECCTIPWKQEMGRDQQLTVGMGGEGAPFSFGEDSLGFEYVLLRVDVWREKKFHVH